jgi:hypothetical protein
MCTQLEIKHSNYRVRSRELCLLRHTAGCLSSSMWSYPDRNFGRTCEDTKYLSKLRFEPVNVSHKLCDVIKTANSGCPQCFADAGETSTKGNTVQASLSDFVSCSVTSVATEPVNVDWLLHYRKLRFVACRLLFKCDGTRAETRFRLSAKQMSPFKSTGASVQSTTGSRGVCISGSNSGYNMFRGSVESTA